MPNPNPAFRLRAAAFLSALLLGAPGCVISPEFESDVVTADGATVEVPLNSASKMNFGDGVVNVIGFQYLPKFTDDGEKGIVMAFESKFSGGARPASVTVDDVTEAPIILVLNDAAPKMIKEVYWYGVTTASLPVSDRYKFLLDLDNTIKVYRFTFRLQDGTVHVVRVPIPVPAEMKLMIRTRLGIA